MNTASTTNDHRHSWDELWSFKSEEEKGQHEEQMLMLACLSEIERYQEAAGMTKKTLAEKINTSASYVTQVFRGNKPLSFYTLAKMAQALHLTFDITATALHYEQEVHNTMMAMRTLIAYTANNGKRATISGKVDYDSYQPNFDIKEPTTI